MNKKIGIVTYYKENYGSVLQCYSTRHYLEKCGYQAVVLYRTENKFKQRIYNIFTHFYRSICYKNYCSEYVKMKKSMSKEKSFLTDNSKKLIDSFIEEQIQPKGYTWNELKKIGKSTEYLAFIAGSDQIWNASIIIDDIYGLKFTEKTKRIAFSPSFGISQIPKFNEKNVSDLLNGFDRISVREETGKQIVKKYTGKDPIRTSDPTILLTSEEWKEISKSVDIPKSQFVFIHFLNEPSDLAIQCINHLVESRDIKAICFSYNYNKYSKIKNYTLYEGSPIDYVGLINNAEVVFTDSFHSTLFSINFNKNFFVFNRQYLHKYPQSSRIIDLLKRCGIPERFILNLEQFNKILFKNLPDCTSVLQADRQITQNYLNIELKNREDRC